MWVVERGGYHVDYKDWWSSDRTWMCDGYLIQRMFCGSDKYVVYTKWWWEKLAAKEKEEVVKHLQMRIQFKLMDDGDKYWKNQMWSGKKDYVETYGSEEGGWVKLPVPIIHSLRRMDEDKVYIHGTTMQLIRVKEIIEKTGLVVKHECIKDIPTLYDAVEIVETLESPYKRKQLKQIVYYKPKRWVQALLGV